jgi:hypothetical protein
MDIVLSLGYEFAGKIIFLAETKEYMLCLEALLGEISITILFRLDW